MNLSEPLYCISFAFPFHLPMPTTQNGNDCFANLGCSQRAARDERLAAKNKGPQPMHKVSWILNRDGTMNRTYRVRSVHKYDAISVLTIFVEYTLISISVTPAFIH